LRTPKDILPDINIPVCAAIWTFTGMPGDDFANTAVLFSEHLKFCEERPQDVVNLSEARKSPRAAKLPARQRESSKGKLNGKSRRITEENPERFSTSTVSN
jgi:hypothetical protein